EGKLINRGFLTGPLCPIYGTGAVVMSVFLTPIKKLTLSAVLFGHKVSLVPVLIFFVGLILADTVEFFTSLIMEKLFHARWWDYSEKPFNIQGRICLQHSIYWGVASIVFMYLVHPFFTSFIVKVFPAEKPTRLYVFLGLVLLIFVIDVINAVKNALDVKSLMDKIHKLSNSMSYIKSEAKNIFSGKLGDIKIDAQKQINKLNSWISDLKSQTNDVFIGFGLRAKSEVQKENSTHNNRLMHVYPNFRRRVKEQLNSIDDILDEIKSRFSDDDGEMY
ncbi:MAG TPA: hypothetical protein PKW24_02685, partial [Clostridiales bacterium]|nr:hypothetical protein [Clostridiales bacterium]